VVAEGDRVGSSPDCNAASIVSNTPFRLRSTSEFQNRSTRNPSRAKSLIAGPIARGVVVEIVLPAVDLDDQSVFHAHEVDDVPTARRLTSK
jgi:hypothetical protein